MRVWAHTALYCIRIQYINRTLRTLFQFIELINGFISKQRAHTHTPVTYRKMQQSKTLCGKHSWRKTHKKRLHTRIELINTTYLLLAQLLVLLLLLYFFLIVAIVVVTAFFAVHFTWFCFALLYIIWIFMAKNRNISLALDCAWPFCCCCYVFCRIIRFETD